MYIFYSNVLFVLWIGSLDNILTIEYATLYGLVYYCIMVDIVYKEISEFIYGTSESKFTTCELKVLLHS